MTVNKKLTHQSQKKFTIIIGSLLSGILVMIGALKIFSINHNYKATIKNCNLEKKRKNEIKNNEKARKQAIENNKKQEEEQKKQKEQAEANACLISQSTQQSIANSVKNKLGDKPAMATSLILSKIPGKGNILQTIGICNMLYGPITAIIGLAFTVIIGMSSYMLSIIL